MPLWPLTCSPCSDLHLDSPGAVEGGNRISIGTGMLKESQDVISCDHSRGNKVVEGRHGAHTPTKAFGRALWDAGRKTAIRVFRCNVDFLRSSTWVRHLVHWHENANPPQRHSPTHVCVWFPAAAVPNQNQCHLDPLEKLVPC